MEDDAVVAPEVWAHQAPRLKPAAGDGYHDRLCRRFAERAPASTFKLNGSSGHMVGINVIDGNDGAGILFLRDLHHLSVNLVALFFGFKFDVEDQVLFRR